MLGERDQGEGDRDEGQDRGGQEESGHPMRCGADEGKGRDDGRRESDCLTCSLRQPNILLNSLTAATSPLPPHISPH